MSHSPRSKDLWTTLLYVLLLLAGIALTCLGVYLAVKTHDYIVLALGVLTIIIPASMAPLLHRSSTGVAASDPRHIQLLQDIKDRLHMSDLARRMADRRKDREALRQAILEDLRNHDYEAAQALTEEMAAKFGYVEEAERYRQQIIDLRMKHRQDVLGNALSRIRGLCAAYDWDTASRELARLQRLFPDEPQVTGLPRAIEQARDNHKRELEHAFLKAAQAGDTDHAMQLLKELDMYLAPAEAAAYLETARGVIGQARENMAVRFRIAVSDRNWIEAMDVGEQIIREFPNSKMANEVRDMMDLLRERAAGQRAAEFGRV
jgi:tetratricopeptide (TPR) repeat protein